METIDTFLMHYGVLGMHWGQRKKEEVGNFQSPNSPMAAWKQNRSLQAKKRTSLGKIVMNQALIAGAAGGVTYAFAKSNNHSIAKGILALSAITSASVLYSDIKQYKQDRANAKASSNRVNKFNNLGSGSEKALKVAAAGATIALGGATAVIGAKFLQQHGGTLLKIAKKSAPTIKRGAQFVGRTSVKTGKLSVRALKAYGKELPKILSAQP